MPTTLLDHLYPENGQDIKLYVSGGSYGTVIAQILHGAPYDKFPYGRCIVEALLLGSASAITKTTQSTWWAYRCYVSLERYLGRISS
ncbi:hypothetical protein JVU11DRAFT_9295 [Chiua virens]|nr:hypothetical protein JVU11DRAFT_9295 [Chiua virens]